MWWIMEEGSIVWSRLTDGSQALPLPGDPIDHDSGDFVDGLGGDEQGLGCGKEVKEGGLFPGLSWRVLRFIAAGKRGDDKTLLFEESDCAWQVIGRGYQQDAS